MREALIEKNIALNCGYDCNPDIDYEVIFAKYDMLPDSSDENEYNGNEDGTIILNLKMIHVIEAYLSAFANLSLAARLRYCMILLYCSDPARAIENDKPDFNSLCFLYSAKLVQIPDRGAGKGYVITTAEGIEFLRRLLVSKDLKQEFK